MESSMRLFVLLSAVCAMGLCWGGPSQRQPGQPGSLQPIRPFQPRTGGFPSGPRLPMRRFRREADGYLFPEIVDEDLLYQPKAEEPEAARQIRSPRREPQEGRTGYDKFILPTYTPPIRPSQTKSYYV